MELLPLPAFDDNYIWTLGDGSGNAVIVDPGEAGPVLRAAEDGLRPIGILLTHHHDDHIGGVAELLARWPPLPVVAPVDARIATATERVGHGDVATIGHWRFETLGVPGHTSSHVAYFRRGDRSHDGSGGDVLFSGDTLFSLGCGRMFEGTAPQMLASLDRLAALPGDTRLCCGHEYTLSNAAFARVVEPDNAALRRRADAVRALRDAGRPSLPSTLSDELETNPFLRTDVADVRTAAEAHAGAALPDRADTFATLRRWKDGFVA